MIYKVVALYLFWFSIVTISYKADKQAMPRVVWWSILPAYYAMVWTVSALAWLIARLEK